MSHPQSADDKCQTCKQTHPFPDGTIPKHPFNDGSLSFTDTFGPRMAAKPAAKPMQWPFDPVLRQALMDKGVLTPEDLTQAEAKIRAVSAEVWNDSSRAIGGA